MTYAVHKRESSGLSLSDSRLRPTVWFEVRFGDDSLVAWRSNTYWADAAPRSINGLRLGASRARNNFQRYFDRTGKRFEVEQKEKRDAERVAKKRADRIAWLTTNLPLQLDELYGLAPTTAALVLRSMQEKAR